LHIEREAGVWVERSQVAAGLFDKKINRIRVSKGASDFDPTSHADFGAQTHPGVGGGTHRRCAAFDRR